MTKKHYERFAKIIGEFQRHENSARLLGELLNFFEEDNSKFNSDRFVERLNEYANK